MRRLSGRRVAAGVLVGLTVPLAGCGSPATAPAASLAPLTSTAAPASPADSSSASPSGSGTSDQAAPQPDPRISEPTAAGAEAAVRHYFAALDYAFATGDVEPLKRISDEGCVSCAGEIARVSGVYSEGGRFVSAPSLVRSISTSRVVKTVESTLLVKAEVAAPGLTEFDSAGSTVTAFPGIDSQFFAVAVAWTNGQWRVLEYSGVRS